MLINGSTSAIINVGDIPGQITPGLARDITNQKMTEYNDLRLNAIRSPHMLQMMARHFMQQRGLFSGVLSMLQSDYNPSAAKDRINQKKTGLRLQGVQDWKDAAFAKNVQLIDDYEFCWRIQQAYGFVYKVTSTAVEQVVGSGQIGQGGTEFPISLNKHLGSMDDVIMLNDMDTQVIITAPPVFNNDGTMSCRVRRKYTYQQAPYMANIGVPIDMLQRGCECQIIYNNKPEASTHGSRIRVERGEFAREFMSTQRYEWDITGHAAATKLGKDNAKWFAFWNSNGEIEPYWMSTMNYEMMRQLAVNRDNLLWNAIPELNADGSFRRDMQGRQYISGTGFYHQTSNRLKRTYNSFNDFSLIDGALRDMNYDSQYKSPVLLCVGGIEARTDFDRLMRNEFSYSPQVLFVKDGQLTGAPAGTTGMGLESDFMYYKTPAGTFIMLPENYFDNKWMPTRRDAQGRSEQSGRMVMINIADQMGGDKVDNIMMVSLPNRQNVVKDYNGMAGPHPVLSTPADVTGKHVLDTVGIAVANPNCMMEFRRARR